LLRQILENVRDRVKGGEMLSDAFAAQGVIPKIYTTTLMAGEKSGNMDEVLTRYINFQRLAITVFMLAVGQNAQKYFPFVFVGSIIVGFGLWRWKDTDRGGDKIDRAILSLPLLGDIRLKHQVASFSRMLSTLLQGGLPLVPAMETAGSAMSSRRILKGVMRAGVRVREGQGLAGSLEEQKIFPELAVEMIEVGESTGALPAMLNSVAEFY